MQQVNGRLNQANNIATEQPLAPEPRQYGPLCERESQTGGDTEPLTRSHLPDSRPFMFEVGAYHCMSQKHFGNLHVDSEGVHFTTSVRSNELWNMQYDELKSMKKVRHASHINYWSNPLQFESKAPPAYGKGLLFERSDEEEFDVYGLKARDEVFTQVIGYSGLRWKSIW